TGHTRQMRPLAGEARREIAELRDLDFQLALQRARALCEKIEDELAAIDDAQVHILFEISRLRGAQRIIENRQVGALAMRNILDLGSLALADEGSRVGRLEFLRDGIDDLGAGGLGERL